MFIKREYSETLSDMPATPKKQLRNQLIRDEILRTALHLYTENGYFNTSIHDIQREAGVSIGSIYNYFGGKEAVAKALYRDLVAKMEALVDDVTAEHGSAYERGLAVVTRLFAMTETDPEVMRFVLASRHREFLPDEPPVCSSRPFVKLRDMVQQGMDRREIRAMDPWVAAACTFGPAIRMIQLRLDGLVPHALRGLGETLWESSWRGVGLEPPPDADKA